MFYWKAVYTDGTCLAQHNGDATEPKYEDIDRDRLQEFQLLLHGQHVFVVLHFNDKRKRLIYRMRVAQHFGGPKAGTKERVWIIGWQMRERITAPRAQKHLCFIYESGRVDVLDDWVPDHPWFYEPNLLEIEQV